MRETDVNIRIELDCEDEFDFRDRGLAATYQGEFLLPSTEILDSDDVVQVELVYRNGKTGVLGTACIVGAGSGGYLAKFVEISLGEIEIVEHWDDTVPPGLVPQGMVRQHEDEPREPQRRKRQERPTEPVPPPQEASRPSQAQPRKRRPTGSASGSRSGSSVSRASSRSRGKSKQRRRRRTSGGPQRAHRLAPVRLAGLPQSPVAEAARARLAARQRRRMLLQTGGLALAAVAVVVTIFLIRSPNKESSDDSKPAVTDPAPPTQAKATTTAEDGSDELSAALKLADQRLAEGRIAGPGGDEALDHLVAARKIGPNDPGVQRRLTAIADKYEQLAADAVADNSLAEALAHLQIVIKADPSREAATKQAQELESKLGKDAVASP